MAIAIALEAQACATARTAFGPDAWQLRVARGRPGGMAAIASHTRCQRCAADVERQVETVAGRLDEAALQLPAARILVVANQLCAAKPILKRAHERVGSSPSSSAQTPFRGRDEDRPERTLTDCKADHSASPPARCREVIAAFPMSQSRTAHSGGSRPIESLRHRPTLRARCGRFARVAAPKAGAHPRHLANAVEMVGGARRLAQAHPGSAPFGLLDILQALLTAAAWRSAGWARSGDSVCTGEPARSASAQVA
jgi:hypothetical protein